MEKDKRQKSQDKSDGKQYGAWGKGHGEEES
jgi:hypothetical protein